MRSLLRLACLAAAASSLCLPRVAAACLPIPPPEPPPRTSAESDSDFAERSRKWYLDLYEAQQKASLPGRIAEEDRLWATARRVVLARIDRIGSIRLRGGDGEYYRSPLFTLRPLEWLKGDPSPRRLKVHYLSDEGCAFGGVGDVSDGEVGDVFLLFYRAGNLGPLDVLDTFDRNRAVTARSRDALARYAHLGPAAERERRLREGAR